MDNLIEIAVLKININYSSVIISGMKYLEDNTENISFRPDFVAKIEPDTVMRRYPITRITFADKTTVATLWDYKEVLNLILSK